MSDSRLDDYNNITIMMISASGQNTENLSWSTAGRIFVSLCLRPSQKAESLSIFICLFSFVQAQTTQ